jgi:hypothetical protein
MRGNVGGMVYNTTIQQRKVKHVEHHESRTRSKVYRRDQLG